MITSYELRKRLAAIARLDVGKTEDTKNRAPWIEKFWPATSYPEGYKNRQPYCAAAISWCVREWLRDADVRAALQLTSFTSAEDWRCESARVREWLTWARIRGVTVRPKNGILHMADLVIYKFTTGHHIEMVTGDDNTTTGAFTAIGFNTNAQLSRDGQGCFEKERSRNSVVAFIRLLP